MAKANLIALILIPLLLSLFFTVSHEQTTQAVSDDWSMVHGNSAHTGYSASALSANPVYLWNFSGASGLLSDVAVSGGCVYFTAYGSIDSDMAFAVNATTGQLIWSTKGSSVSDSALVLSPAIAEGIVYTTNDAFNASTGDLLFSYTSYLGSTSPTVANGMIYLGTNVNNFFAPGGVVAINAKTGEKIWNFTGEEGQFMYGGMVHSPPAVEDGVVYFSSGGGIYALNGQNGKVLWRNTEIDPGLGSLGNIAVGNGRIYDNVGGKLFCVGASTWTYPVGGRSDAFPAIVNGFVYACSYALDASWQNGVE
jgi:outer membrane protein assembly factor BamB